LTWLFRTLAGWLGLRPASDPGSPNTQPERTVDPSPDRRSVDSPPTAEAGSDGLEPDEDENVYPLW
jgi:hypothetical protein